MSVSGSMQSRLSSPYYVKDLGPNLKDELLMYLNHLHRQFFQNLRFFGPYFKNLKFPLFHTAISMLTLEIELPCPTRLQFKKYFSALHNGAFHQFSP